MDDLYQYDTHTIANPKEYVIGLARRSRLRTIREDIAPRKGDIRRVGPNYNGRLIEFANKKWNARKAARRSDSLRRALLRLDRFTFSPAADT